MAAARASDGKVKVQWISNTGKGKKAKQKKLSRWVEKKTITK